MTRGRPTKDESEKAQVIQITIQGKDKTEIDEYAKQIGLEGREKELYRASLLSMTSATQYLDFENRTKSLEQQIKQRKERHARDRARLEQALIDLDTDFTEDVQNLESELATATANLLSIKRFGENPNGTLTDAKDRLGEIVQADKERIVSAIEQNKISKQSSTDAQKLYDYENPNGFSRKLFTIRKAILDNQSSSRWGTHTPESSINMMFDDLVQIATQINWDRITQINARQTLEFLNKDGLEQYDQARKITEIINISVKSEGTI